MIRAWFADLLMRVKHPMYAGQIEILPPSPVEETADDA